MQEKTLNNTSGQEAKENVSDIQFFGDPDTFLLICKAWSKKEGWMKSTKAMEVFGLGCIVQVTTQVKDNVSEALTFVPGARILEILEKNTDKVLKRKLIQDIA